MCYPHTYTNTAVKCTIRSKALCSDMVSIIFENHDTWQLCVFEQNTCFEQTKNVCVLFVLNNK